MNTDFKQISPQEKRNSRDYFMREEMSPAVQRAIDLAIEWAKERNYSQLTGVALIWGLIAEQDGKVAILLTEHGLDLIKVRELLLSLQINEPIPLNDILNRAKDLAFEWQIDHTITGDFLILGILDSHPEILQKFQEQGLDYQNFSQAIRGEGRQEISLEEPLFVDESQDFIQSARIMDVNLNRISEGLRILEDYTRFILDDHLLTQMLKEIRHELAETMNLLGPDLLLKQRDTMGDIGTSITAGNEYRRRSIKEIALINSKRIGEALRSLEEYGKLYQSELAIRIEKIRYRFYTLEQSIYQYSNAKKNLQDIHVYALITSSACISSLEWTIAEAAKGGIKMFQFREKNIHDRELLSRAKRFRRATRQANALMIVNDRPDIAVLSHADGVHLGQEDLEIPQIRKIVGSEMMIGVSTHSLEDVKKAILAGADYIGIGPTFPSSTKSFSSFPGLDFVRQVSQECSLPAFVIGGINLNNLDKVIQAGATKIAISSAICQSEEPQLTASHFVEAMNNNRPNL